MTQNIPRLNQQGQFSKLKDLRKNIRIVFLTTTYHLQLRHISDTWRIEGCTAYKRAIKVNKMNSNWQGVIHLIRTQNFSKFFSFSENFANVQNEWSPKTGYLFSKICVYRMLRAPKIKPGSIWPMEKHSPGITCWILPQLSLSFWSLTERKLT